MKQTIQQFEHDNERGFVKSVAVVSTPGQAWFIEWETGNGWVSKLETTRGDVREFKTLDAAASVLGHAKVAAFSVRMVPGLA